ncbi:histone deacetylase clr6-like [Lolium rigidum]|uniref:histone deacetylase clr6-like n=1 Tax=Lolium rigidum TaxID=89674 RepID=UPI001F5C12E1|nr:histone deacetylase clr6-like [Lolium rigidum]
MEMEGNSLPSSSCPDGRKRRVCYYYDPGIANVDYGAHHVMVPRRVAMTHGLVTSYKLLPDMELLRTRPATEDELAGILTDDYLRLLRDLTPGTYRADTAGRHHIGALSGDERNDNPVIDGLWDYCARYAGGSLAAARALGSGKSDIAINWSGGMHHACSGEASGFCYVNDIVLAIRELLAAFPRVLYVDIDVHHGDGVEKYFAADGRVMTVSFHQYGRGGKGGDTFFFPGTGSAEDVGEGAGKYRTLNVPMKAGMDDAGYRELFVPIMREVMGVFRPDAIVLQCGADSLSGDRLGEFNLSVRGHAECVRYLRSFNVPLLLLGGGGYTINHVASCWCYETAVAVGKEKEIPDDIPHHGYEHYYKDQGYKLHYGVTKVGRNAAGTKEHMDNIRNEALKNVQNLHELLKHGVAPSVQFKDIHDRELYKKPPKTSGPKKRRGRDGDAEDPMDRLHRLCGEADVRNFFARVGEENIRGAASSPGRETKIYEEQRRRASSAAVHRFCH